MKRATRNIRVQREKPGSLPSARPGSAPTRNDDRVVIGKTSLACRNLVANIQSLVDPSVHSLRLRGCKGLLELFRVIRVSVGIVTVLRSERIQFAQGLYRTILAVKANGLCVLTRYN